MQKDVKERYFPRKVWQDILDGKKRVIPIQSAKHRRNIHKWAEAAGVPCRTVEDWCSSTRVIRSNHEHDDYNGDNFDTYSLAPHYDIVINDGKGRQIIGKDYQLSIIVDASYPINFRKKLINRRYKCEFVDYVPLLKTYFPHDIACIIFDYFSLSARMKTF